MKRFILTILICITIPLIILAGMYLWTDPFRCIHPFDINDVDATNREYLSTELFLRNNQIYHYNSFIFASSRGGGMNTYTWKQYLPEDAQPFLFQAWSETLTGIELKLKYLSDNNIQIDNALVMFDIPGTFKEQQLPCDALSLKHYMFTNQSHFTYNIIQFTNFIQKPSLWGKSIQRKINNVHMAYNSDTITNDWEIINKDNYLELPPQDSLKQCSDMTRRTFMAKIEHGEEQMTISEPLIDAQYEKQLRHVHAILEANHTDYHIIITPAPRYMNPAINPEDLQKLQQIFKEERVHNYTGDNEYTRDYNNFSDPSHFGLRVGYLMVEDIYRR